MKVVIVDDVQMNVTLLKHLALKLSDAEAVCFTDPLAALDWCLANDPDLVVVAYMMPGLSGTDLVKSFRVKYPDTPVLMVTANHELALRHQALEIGVTDFLNKPINNTEFLARAKNMLALNRSHRHLAEEVRKATAKLVEQERETIFCLAKAAEYRDPETGARVILEMYQPLRQHLEKALAVPVEVVTAPDFTEFARRLLHQDHDLAVTTGHQARLAQTDASYTPLLTYSAEFRAVALVAGNSPIRRAEDLKDKPVLGLSSTSLVTLWGQQSLR